MSAISIPAASACLSVLFLLSTLPAQTTSEAGPHPAVSKVRIVRLSEANGSVQMDRNVGRGYEPVMANLPIVEHSRLQTVVGVAEVEFEDNSTLRVAPNSIVEFEELDRLPGGATVSSVRLVKGMAYVSLLKTKSQGNEFNILLGQQKLLLPPSSHIRLQTDGAQGTLAVFDGTVRIEGPGGSTDVPKKKTVTFPSLDQAAQPIVAKNVVPAALDSWDKDAAERHAQSSNSAFGSPYSYGLSDMMYYGSFMNAGGCGSMWRPYFASAAWNPYSNGVWAWYQGAGYSWVSPYPWGWTPFHFGSWSYCSGTGWGWRPGGAWNGLNNTAALVSGGGGGAAVVSPGSPARPIGPTRPPGPGEPTLKVMNLRPLVWSQAVSADSFVFRKDSAGLGIPREGMGRLNRLSQNTINRGTATTPIYLTAPSPTLRNGRSVGEGIVPTSIHRGSAPADTQMSWQRGQSNGGGGNSTRSGSEANSSPVRSMSQPSNEPARSMSQPSSQPMSQPSSQPMSPSSQPMSPSSTPMQGRPR